MDTYSVILLVAIFVLSYLFLRREKRHGKLPPGPRPLPFIGNLLHVVGKDPRKLCSEYRKTYGDLFTLHVFNRLIIDVNGHEAIKDICKKNGEIFSRMPEFEVIKLLPGKGIAFVNGDIWKQHRRFLIRCLKDFGMGKSTLQAAIHEEIEHFLNVIEKEGEQPFDIEYYITIAVSNIICSIVFGKRFDYEDDKFIDVVRRVKEILASGILTMPLWFKHIPGDPFHFKMFIDNVNHLRDFYREKLQEHIENFDEDSIRDLMDACIKEMKQGGHSEKQYTINEDDVIHIVFEVFLAGTGSTSVTLRYALACMLRNRETQERLSDELRENVPNHVLPNMDDFKRLPFLQATLSEVQRRACVQPFLIRAGHEDFQYRGYTIPKEAIVRVNLDSVSFDETLWKEPLKFNPSRFMDENGFNTKKEEHTPFGIGLRICAGESIARMTLNLFFAALLHRFKLLPPENEEPPSLDTQPGFTLVVVPPYKLRAIRRK